MLQLYQSLPEKVITDFFLIRCYKGRPIEYSYKISFQNDEPVLYRTTFCKISNYPQMDLVVIWFERVQNVDFLSKYGSLNFQNAHAWGKILKKPEICQNQEKSHKITKNA